jgi:hypothetical protein
MFEYINDFIPCEDINDFTDIATNLELGYESEWIPKFNIPSAWTTNIPIAFWLIKTVKPHTLVELGTERGISYMAFNQAVTRLGLPTESFAVDLWLYEEFGKRFGDIVYESVLKYNNENYSSFSKIIRSSFDDVAPQFNKGQIDLLHIDGTHTYKAVKNDYDTWINKMSERGVIIFHDINVIDEAKTFGVHIFWNEIRKKYPSFSFNFREGLGVLGVGNNQPKPLKFLFSADNDTALKIQTIFAVRGMRVKQDVNIQDTLSWRITAPLRKISQWLYRFKLYQRMRR